MRTNTEKGIITCPTCGAEYLPAEIYLPDSFLGKPKNIEKDHTTSRILDYMGTEMDTVEYYRCDHCDNKFKVSARVHFDTYSENSKDYSTNLRKEALFLDEG